MNGFTKKSVGTLTLGEKLRKLRSDKRISLNDISKITKIQISYLEYLEAGDYGKLPADVYVKGFLRSYADFLGVDEKILFKLYEKEKGIRNNLEKKSKPKMEKEKKIDISAFIFTPKKIIFFVVGGIVFISLFFLFKEINSFASEPSLVILSPENNSEVSDSSIFIEGLTDKEASLFINEQPILVGDEGKFKESVTLQAGINHINIKVINKFKKETQSNLIVKLNSQETKNTMGQAGEGQSANENDDKNQKNEFEVDLRVDPGPVWLSVEADGNLVFSGTMLTGAVQMFKAQEKITINSGKGNATFVSFNGKEIGALSEEPNPVRDVVFSRDTKY